MATDVSKMSVAELDKLSAKIEKRRDELAKHEALAQMQAVAKKHGVDFAEIARLHGQKLPKAPRKMPRQSTAKTTVKSAPKAKAKTTAKVAAKAAPKTPAKATVKTQVKTAPKTITKLASSAKKTSKVKYKNPDNPEQTWSGMGRKPAWFIAQLDAGKKLEGMVA